MQILGGRIGLFVEWAGCIETGGGTLEEKRLEYRELLGEMAIYEEELNGAELKHYNDLTTIAWWELDETEDAERGIAHSPRWSTSAHSTSALWVGRMGTHFPSRVDGAL